MITADNKQFKKKMKETSQETKKTTGQVNKGFKGMATAIKGAAAVAAFAITAKIIGGLTKLTKSLGLMDLKATAVFGAYRKEVDMMAKESAQSMGLTEAGFTNAAAGIQDLLIPIGFARKEATKMTLETMKLAGAMSAWTGGMYSAEEVGQIFSKAVLGEREQLKSLGIAISEAEVKSRLLAKGQANLTGQALAQAKAQATLELITEKSTDAQVAFEEGQDNIVITSAQVRSSLKGVADDMATILKPAVEEGTRKLLDLTTQLKDLTGGLVEVAKTDMSFYDKLRYGLANATGGFAGMAIQQGILNKNNEMTASTIEDVISKLMDQGKTWDEIKNQFSEAGDGMVMRALGIYMNLKKLREKDAKETLAQEKASQAERLQQQKDFYWAMEGHAMAHGETVAGALADGYKGMGTAINEANMGLESHHGSLQKAMELYPLMLPMIQAQTQAMIDQAEAEERAAKRKEMFENALVSLEEAAWQASVAMVQASGQSGASFKDMANAAVSAAKRVVSAAIAEGIAKQISSALTGIPFPFGLIAGSMAGAGAAALFNQLIPSFAEGGMVTQPTLALVGDNPSGKEMIIPWEKIGELGGGGQMDVGGIIKGSNIHLVNNRYTDKLKRTGRA